MTTLDPVAIGQRIREGRTRKQLSVPDVASVLEVREGCVYSYEAGRIPPVDKLAKLATLFGVSVDWLLGGER